MSCMKTKKDMDILISRSWYEKKKKKGVHDVNFLKKLIWKIKSPWVECKIKKDIDVLISKSWYDRKKKSWNGKKEKEKKNRKKDPRCKIRKDSLLI